MNKIKGPGRPEKTAKEKKVRKNIQFSPENAERLDTIPDGQRSKLVNNSLALYFAVIDGKVIFDETKTHADFDLAKILNS